jgi:hypothetical protein
MANPWNQHTVKLHFQSTHALQTTDVSPVSFGVFQAINASFPMDVKILTNTGKNTEMTPCSYSFR